MTQPSYEQYKTLNAGDGNTNNTTLATGMINESIWERILTCLCVLASQQNPDGSTYVA